MHDKSMTKRRTGASQNRPFMQIKHGSAIVPIYRGLVNGRTRIPAYARQIVQCTDTTRLEHAFCATCYTHTADSQSAA